MNAQCPIWPIDEYLDVKMCTCIHVYTYTCDSTGNKQLIQIPKYKYNNNKTNDRAKRNRNELTICGLQLGPVVNLLNKIKTALVRSM